MILQEISETPPPVSSVVAPPQPSRPTIKLRVNGANGSSAVPSSDVSKPAKVLKPKVTPLPSPAAPKRPPPKRPPDDDGDNDDDDAVKELLEEVLAIEEEQKLEKRMTRTGGSGTSTPNKKEYREKGHEGSHRKEKEKDRDKPKERDVPSTPAQPAVLPKLIVKKPTNGNGTSSVSVKGKGKEKEKEAARSMPAGSSKQQGQSDAVANNGTPVNEKRCKEILKKLVALPQALLFRRPVDAKLLGCPTYVSQNFLIST